MAFFLKKTGMASEVFEANQATSPLGAGLSLTPNGVYVLAGVHPVLRKQEQKGRDRRMGKYGVSKK